MSRLEEFYQKHVAQAREHEQSGNVKLALREWREARRLRPHHPDPGAEIARLENISSQEISSQVSLNAVTASFNLTVRYWDKGEGSFALAEARKCKEALEKTGLAERHGLGCVGHNLSAILAVSRSPSTRGYAEALRLFDRRMMLACERKLVEVEQDLRLRRRDLSGVKDDLLYVHELKRKFDLTHYGLPLLPCLKARFLEEGDPNLDECVQWRRALAEDSGVAWN